MVAFSPDGFVRFLAEEDDGPVVILNLLRFMPDGGRERHLEYLRMAEPILARFGARILLEALRSKAKAVLNTDIMQGASTGRRFRSLQELKTADSRNLNALNISIVLDIWKTMVR